MAARHLHAEERGRVDGYVRGIVLVALVSLAAYLLLLAPRGAPSSRDFAFAGALAACAWLLHHADVSLPWGRAHLAVDLDEAVVFLALAIVPTVLLPLVMLPGTVVRQVTKRRPLVKGAFNVGSRAIATVLAGALFFVVAPWSPLAGAALGTALYSLTTQVLVAPVLARVSGTTVMQVVRGRLVMPTAVQIILGVAGGVVAFALWNVHPLALVAIVPFLFLAHRFARYHERAERVLQVHEKLQALQASLAGRRSADEIAQRSLDAVVELLGPADATLTAVVGDEPRTWRRSTGEPWQGDTHVAPLVGPSGQLYGTLRVDASRPAANAMTPATLRLVAEQVAGAMERAGLRAQ